MYWSEDYRGYQRPTVFIFSGRDDSCLDITRTWLDDHSIQHNHLVMRREEDNRPDYIVKKEMYFEHIDGKYHVVFVLDDRNSVVDEWRSMGLKVLQVEDGDF